MQNELSKVRSHLAANRSAKGRVPAKVRREVLVFVERARAAGATYREIAKEIDVSIHTDHGDGINKSIYSIPNGDASSGGSTRIN